MAKNQMPKKLIENTECKNPTKNRKQKGCHLKFDSENISKNLKKKCLVAKKNCSARKSDLKKRFIAESLTVKIPTAKVLMT